MYSVCIRVFDVVSSCLMLVALSWLFLFIAIWILLDSRGGIFYKQERVGGLKGPHLNRLSENCCEHQMLYYILIIYINIRQYIVYI
ncbi:MAG: sugar transferase [Chitinophagaceae bacterium]|nr:sugar transferase [Chitinophagaceae bacterium]